MLAALAMMAAETVAGLPVGQWRPEAAAPVTDCDRLAAYQSDRNAVSPGVAHAAIDMPRAEAACWAAVARYPAEPRFAYQLSRLLGYKRADAEAEAMRRRAVAGGYPVAIFVAGHRLAFGEGVAPDRCGGAALIARAAQAGDFAAAISFADETLKGSFKACPPTDAATLLERNKAKASGHFEQILVDVLLRDLKRGAGA